MRRYELASGILFTIIAAGQLTRLLLKWPVQVSTFVVPLWQWHAHENLSNEEAVLFSINDRPIMDGLKLYREESN